MRALPPMYRGEQPQGGRIIKLNTMSCLPAAPKCNRRRKREAGSANLYNDPDCHLAGQAVAKGLGVPKTGCFKQRQ